jgi:hypothetical protein
MAPRRLRRPGKSKKNAMLRLVKYARVGCNNKQEQQLQRTTAYVTIQRRLVIDFIPIGGMCGTGEKRPPVCRVSHRQSHTTV